VLAKLTSGIITKRPSSPKRENLGGVRGKEEEVARKEKPVGPRQGHVHISRVRSGHASKMNQKGNRTKGEENGGTGPTWGY